VDVSQLSPARAEHHPIRAVPGASPAGRLSGMANTQHEARVSDDSEGAQTEESRSPEATAATVARMLANPRRIRRD
jgi:hypothetical protein